MIINLKDEKLEALIKDETVVVVDFYATWCGPCKMLSPILEEIANERNIKLIKVNVDEHEDLARVYKVMSIPNVFIFKNGNLISNFVGFMPKNNILKEIDK